MIPTLREAVIDRHAKTQHFGPLFDYDHLPEHLRAVSAPCHDLAAHMVLNLSDGEELWAGLRKLLEGKDCFVRQMVIG